MTPKSEIHLLSKMNMPERTLVLLGVLLILLSFEEGAEGVRLCGRRLSDLLNFICEKRGGFHAPREKREVQSKLSNKRSVSELRKPMSRRSDPEASGSAFEGEIMFNYQNGIVDECCKKPCTLSTMVSYCANAQRNENLNLEELLPVGIENLPSVTDEDLVEYRAQQVPTAALLISPNEVMSPPQNSPSRVAYSSRLNLGLSPRNRPVFIVLSQLQQEDEDRALGEYRF